MSVTKIFPTDHFLGLNQSDIGQTELKRGEAIVCENFYITDGYNLRSRPGIVRWGQTGSRSVDNSYRFFWSGYIKETPCVVAFGLKPGDAYITAFSEHGQTTVSINVNITHVVQNGKRLCAVYRSLEDRTQVGMLYIDYQPTEEGQWELVLTEAKPYIPLVITGADPAGGGANRENLNVLTDLFRVGFFGKEGVTAYTLPDNAAEVLSVCVGNTKYLPESKGNFDPESRVFTFTDAPQAQEEVVFVCRGGSESLTQAREKFLNMGQWEYFNGGTDNRIFFYGDGTNVCYYTSPAAFAFDNGYGTPSADDAQIADGTEYPVGLYLPALNEIAVDFSDSPITGMIRDYSRLMVFKPDGVDAITYSPMTLADGKVIAGFYLHTVNRDFGNDAMGQVRLVNNYPRSFTHGSMYEWRVSSAYRDERFAKCVSEKVARTLRTADPKKIVVCDDERTKTYYAFLNDEQGTVLVNRYELDAWSIYTSELTKYVTHAFTAFDRVVFAMGGELFTFDESITRDENPVKGEEYVPFECVYESGYMDFDAPYLRKYASEIWISMQPEALSQMDVTVQTDRRNEYITKTVGTNVFSFADIDFSNFSFLVNTAPKIQRIRIKVKKFVYYKMIFKVTRPGARATVLGYDQKVRYASQVK